MFVLIVYTYYNERSVSVILNPDDYVLLTGDLQFSARGGFVLNNAQRTLNGQHHYVSKH